MATEKMDRKYKAQLLKEMLSDDTNYLYFVFATPVVNESERVNSLLQQTKADAHTLYKDLQMHQQSLHNRLYDCKGAKRHIDEVDFGVQFLIEYDNVQKKNVKTQQEVEDVKKRCLSMLEEADRQVSKRLPPNTNTFHALAKLNPTVVLNQVSRPPFSMLPLLHLTGKKIGKIEEQYRKIIFIDWNEETAFRSSGIPKDSEEFWVGVLHHDSFKELAMYALTCLVTPVSNAIVEKIFSIVASVKTKARNRMQLPLLDAIIRIRADFMLSGKCCKNVQASPKMLQNYAADNVYANVKDPNTDTEANMEDEGLDMFL